MRPGARGARRGLTGHVQQRLRHRKLEDGARAVDFSEVGLKLRELDPRVAVGRVELQELLVDRATAIHVAELQLQLDVLVENHRLGSPVKPCSAALA